MFFPEFGGRKLGVRIIQEYLLYTTKNGNS